MGDPVIAIIASVVGYLVGSLSFARIVTRMVAPDIDITKTELTVGVAGERYEYHNVGGMTVSEQLGNKYGGMVGMLDVVKVFVPTLLFRLVFPGQAYYLVVATAGMIGHNWPAYYRFRGGTGFSAAYGGLLAIAPFGTFVTSFGGLAVGLVVIRNLGIAWMLGPLLILPWLWFATHSLAHLAYGVVLNLFLLLGLIPGIKQAVALRKQGVSTDFASQMRFDSMSRMIAKLGKRIGLFQDLAE
jgi:acyl phosphate:glycerol-3-phosphate acyltransferase